MHTLICFGVRLNGKIITKHFENNRVPLNQVLPTLYMHIKWLIQETFTCNRRHHYGIWTLNFQLIGIYKYSKELTCTSLNWCNFNMIGLCSTQLYWYISTLYKLLFVCIGIKQHYICCFISFIHGHRPYLGHFNSPIYTAKSALKHGNDDHCQ